MYLRLYVYQSKHKVGSSLCIKKTSGHLKAFIKQNFILTKQSQICFFLISCFLAKTTWIIKIFCLIGNHYWSLALKLCRFIGFYLKYMVYIFYFRTLILKKITHALSNYNWVWTFRPFLKLKSGRILAKELNFSVLYFTTGESKVLKRCSYYFIKTA